PAQRARDVRAHVDAVAAGGDGLEHVIEARDGLQIGRGHLHHAGDLPDRLRRAPAVHALGGRERRQRRGAAVGVVRHVHLDLLTQPGWHLYAAGRRDLGRVLLEVGGAVPARDTRAVLEAGHARRFAVRALEIELFDQPPG